MTDRRDDMHDRLTACGDRWRRTQTTTPSVDLERLTPPDGRHRAWWLIPATAAAAVAAVIAGSQFAQQEPSKPAEPQHHVRPGDVIPWAPLRATHPQLPKVTIPARPDPAAAAQAPPCRATDLRTTSSPEATTSALLRYVKIFTSTTKPCRVEGFPKLVPLNNGHPVNIPVRRMMSGTNWHHPVLIAKGRPAVLLLSWGMNWCRPAVKNDAIRAVLPHGAGSMMLAGYGETPGCKYGGTNVPAREPIRVQPFEPEHWHPRRVASLYATVRARPTLHPTVSPGGRVRFVVTLVSSRRVVLNPCPDYTVSQSASHSAHEQRFALNCAAVPYTDSRGQPYLPAHTPVRFAMETTASAPGVYKLSWQLATPKLSADAGGTLIVR